MYDVEIRDGVKIKRLEWFNEVPPDEFNGDVEGTAKKQFLQYIAEHVFPYVSIRDLGEETIINANGGGDTDRQLVRRLYMKLQVVVQPDFKGE